MAEICPICGLPKELCVCEEIAREQQKIKIYTEKRRYGKTVTVVEGIKSDIDINDLAKKLKTKCASGGTVKNGNIELQGDHKKKVQEALRKIGFNAETR
ncbi:MAG: stress response translation initiation inhibitor YciH [Candidatus Thermoplasmatota archaeon]|nr:stress response translation initiation inhibitor YciH [archaeon]MBU2565563.1 stress response translation initiation inhibitor YciH [Candidatus Thermoplasmatota archaeon]MBU3902266.1 stress response translation initiation inhibitor YciH [Candidatus Thermoplasmatota archaeon]MBU4255641.1 stress response translation initiation inhibitor YciH [Candidatus Thermoplasmatota archaeon]MCG2826501.1 stress response translation initiation inhibitor YciH [Thermoplasmatales archaeon]